MQVGRSSDEQRDQNIQIGPNNFLLRYGQGPHEVGIGIDREREGVLEDGHFAQ
jgi:hypothetical protein